MTDSGGSDDEQAVKIELKFKTTTETFSSQAKECWTIMKIRKIVAEKLNQPLEKVCLIFSGKVLKDHETLVQHKIGNGMVIHVVIRQQVKPSENAQSASSSFQQQTAAPSPAQSFGPQQLLNNDFMRQMMNSPMIQGLFDNPEIIRSMLTQNPQIQQLIQSNPEIGRLLSDTQIIRETMEIVQNPTRLNELMRNHDQAVRNLQGIPGGEAALQRLYQDVQEPLLNSALGSMNANPFSTPPNTQTTQAASRSQRAGVENREALPNPWGSIVGTPQATNAPTSGENQNAPLTSEENQTTAQPGNPFGMFNTPGIQSLFRQLSSNPAMMQNMMSPENMQQFSNLIAQNPSLIQQVAQSFPGIDGATINQAMNAVPTTEMMRIFSNPRALNAFNQIMEATRVLREEAPTLFQNNSLFDGLGSLFNQAVPSATAPSAPQGAGETQQQSTGANIGIPQGFGELMNQMMQLNPGNNQPPEERFRSQLEQLVTMGFTDQQRNVEALTATFGDLSAAIERLLSNN